MNPKNAKAIMWNEIVAAVKLDLADLSDITNITQVTFRLGIAAILGGILGFDREMKGKAAGLRTHMLVAIGAAFFVMVPKIAGMPDLGIARILEGLITGIGFLGAGSILKANQESQIQGLTTAAGLWLTAAIGGAVGFGRVGMPILCALFSVFILSFIPLFYKIRGPR